MPSALIPLVLAIAWGLNWPAVKIMLSVLPPFAARGIGLTPQAKLALQTRYLAAD